MKFFEKWYTYQKERFPLLTYGLYCFCLVFGTFCFSNYISKINYDNLFASQPMILYKINYYMLIPTFIVGFLQFLMVRIIDEFKDYEEDCKYRPYRPVPRGLVSLKELKILFIICAILQVLITIIIIPQNIIFLGMVWIFFIIMTKEFFVKKFLNKHIFCEVFLDEFLLPITVVYIASFICKINLRLIWKFLFMTYFISWIIEIARKIRCKEEEENGVKTYTAVLGIPRATILLWILETILLIIFRLIINLKLYMIIAYVLVSIINILFMIKQSIFFSKCVEYFADTYVMILLVSLVYLIL